MLLAILTCVLTATPAIELETALADLRQLPAHEQRETRYVTLYNLMPGERNEAAAAVSFLLNSVSRTGTIVRPSALANGRLLRFSLAWYGLPPEVWEALVSDREPYFHLTSQALDPATRKVKTVYTDGGWLNLARAAELRALTQSGGAVVRGDWLVSRVALPPHYYQFAAVAQTESEFLARLGLDLRAIDDLAADAGANLIFSQVTRKVRRVVRRPGPLGGAWHTYDVERSTPERDPLRNPFAFTYDAGEHIAAKRNGLHLFALYDRNGRRQDAVPDRIAKDTSDPHGDGIIAPLISCVRCHVEDGLRPFVNDQQRLLSGGVDLFADRAENAQRLAEFYDSDLGKQLRRDREDYAEAVSAATGGMTTAATAAALGRLFRGYVYELVTPEKAAAELGLSGNLHTALASSRDPVILALCERVAVQREQWEASFAEAAVLAAGK
jgi:hypothetical protein